MSASEKNSVSVKSPKIIFQNEQFIVVDKPARVLSVFSRAGEKEERPVISSFLAGVLGGKETDYYPCHRLDYEVSGLIIFARNSKAHAISQKWFESQVIQKTYLAKTHLKGQDSWPNDIPRKIVSEKLEPGQAWTWKTMMSRGKRRSYVNPHGLLAVTEAEFLSDDVTSDTLFWKLKPVTGRSHQLRLEMVQRGFAIRGDSLYGSLDKSDGGIALQAWELDLSKVKPEELLGLPQKMHAEEPLFNV